MDSIIEIVGIAFLLFTIFGSLATILVLGLLEAAKSSDLDKTIEMIIDSIRDIPYETQYFLSRQGDIIVCSTQYDDKSVTLTDEQAADLKQRPGSISIHNHDDDVPPSGRDFAFAGNFSCSSIIVVCPHCTYTVIPSSSGWGTPETIDAAFRKYSHLLKPVDQHHRFVGVDRGGGMLIETITEYETTDQAIEAIARELGYTYQKKELE